jgi:hypothetical protein
MSQQSTTQIFINKAKIKHHHFYDYTLVEYSNNFTKVRIICPIHGEFQQRPNQHLNGNGCYECGRIKTIQKQTGLLSDFINRANIIHSKFYSYENAKYQTARIKLLVTCPIHGDFSITPDNHLRDKGCHKCAKMIINRHRTAKSKNFKEKARLYHNNFYTYENSIFNGVREKLLVTCPIHRDFSVTPDNHLRGRGCPSCNNSRGETKIENILIKLGVPFSKQIRFNDCKFKRALPFDFGVYNNNQKLNGLIEFQGKQHFKPVFIWNGNDGLKTIQERDKIKMEYCMSHRIPLLELNYNESKTTEKKILSFIFLL